MTSVARFTVIPESDNDITLPTPDGINDVHFQGFRAPDIDSRSPAVLAFRVNPKGTTAVKLRVRLQNSGGSTVLLEVNYTSDAARSWHEIIPAGALAADGNELIVSVTGPGSLQVSDFVFLYHANIP
jgi:hypothetical protein